MARTVKELCRPNETVFDDSLLDRVESLQDFIDGRIDPGAFFAKNHTTGGMKTLFEQGFERLAGRSSKAVFKLTQGMGGGKTHSVIAFGLLASSAATRLAMFPADPNAAGFGDAQIIAINGREDFATYLWGYIAERLGKASDFEAFWKQVARAPSPSDWERLIGDAPVVIAFDELPTYLDIAESIAIGSSDLGRVSVRAIANLLVAVCNLPRALVIITDLQNTYQRGSEMISEAMRNLSGEADRQAMDIAPVQLNTDEIYHILRKRIFSSYPEPGSNEIEEVAEAYVETLRKAKAMDVVVGTPESIKERIHASYPFHPSLRDLAARFRENPNYQQTRDLITLMRLVTRSVLAPDRSDAPYLIGFQHCWVDHMGHRIPGRAAEDVTRCPYVIGIVSTGLIVQPTAEKVALQACRFSCVVLDEAHKARRQDLSDPGRNAPGNNLLEFMRTVASRSRHVLLGTATPIQIDPIELWDLVDVLGREAAHVLGDGNSPWKVDPARVLDYLLDRQPLPTEPVERFELIANPLAPPGEPPAALFKAIRTDLDLPDDVSTAKGKFKLLSGPSRRRLHDGFEDAFWSSNPFVRHVVLRKRDMIERIVDPLTGEPYLRRVEVVTHPRPEADGFVEGAVAMPLLFRQAYDDAKEFCDLLGQRVKGAGFLKTILLRRIGSTVEAGLGTARKLLGGDASSDETEEADVYPSPEEREDIRDLTADESNALRRVIARLEDLTRAPDADPKGALVARYLRSGWLEHGCIVFSQYYDSAHWLARTLAAQLPAERIGLYGGSGRSLILHEGTSVKADRNLIKEEVAKRNIRLLIATDAACEGLNLQALGTLVNLDLPWNPAKLEQRKGRIQGIGQSRSTIDILNLRYRDSVEDDVFAVLSERFQNIWTVFRQFPDALDDAWIQAVLKGREQARSFLRELPDQSDRFRLRYQSSIEDVDWESCSSVLARQDIIDAMSEGW